MMTWTKYDRADPAMANFECHLAHAVATATGDLVIDVTWPVDANQAGIWAMAMKPL